MKKFIVFLFVFYSFSYSSIDLLLDIKNDKMIYKSGSYLSDSYMFNKFYYLHSDGRIELAGTSFRTHFDATSPTSQQSAWTFDALTALNGETGSSYGMSDIIGNNNRFPAQDSRYESEELLRNPIIVIPPPSVGGDFNETAFNNGMIKGINVFYETIKEFIPFIFGYLFAYYLLVLVIKKIKNIFGSKVVSSANSPRRTKKSTPGSGSKTMSNADLRKANESSFKSNHQRELDMGFFND